MTDKHGRFWILVAVVASLVFAGCVDGGTPDDDGTEGGSGDGEKTSASLDLPWALSDCRVVVALIPVAVEAVRPHLPEGFEPVSGEEAFGLPPDVRGDAVVGLETFACASGTGLNETVDDLAYGAYFTAAAPPEEHRVEGAEIPLYKWDTLVPDDARRAFLATRGLPVRDGATDLSGLEANPAGHTFDVSLQMGEDVHRFTGSANQPAEGFRQGFYFVEHMEANGGLAAWHMPDNEAPDALSGTGVVELAPGTLPREIVGAGSSQAFFASATTVQFRNGTIELPPAASPAD